MSEAIASKLESIISGHKVNADDADWLRAALSQPSPSPQPAVPVVSGWSIDDHRDGSVTIETPEGRIISLHRSGGSGMESTAYSLALLALRPAVEPMTPEQREVLAALVVGACEHKTRTLLALRAIEATEAQYGIGITAKAEGGA